MSTILSAATNTVSGAATNVGQFFDRNPMAKKVLAVGTAALVTGGATYYFYPAISSAVSSTASATYSALSSAANATYSKLSSAVNTSYATVSNYLSLETCVPKENIVAEAVNAVIEPGSPGYLNGYVFGFGKTPDQVVTAAKDAVKETISVCTPTKLGSALAAIKNNGAVIAGVGTGAVTSFLGAKYYNLEVVQA